MFDKVVDEFQSKAKAYVAGAFLAVVAAVGQAGAVSDVNNLGLESWGKALGVAALGALAVYFKGNVDKPAT